MKLLKNWPFLRRIPARMIGVGFRAEHVGGLATNSSLSMNR